MTKYIAQWYWDRDYLGNKYKAIYYGPKLDWMKEIKDEKSVGKRRNKTSKGTKEKI